MKFLILNSTIIFRKNKIILYFVMNYDSSNILFLLSIVFGKILDASAKI